MTARYEVHPGGEHPHPARGYAYTSEAFWHKRAANGEITAVSEIFDRHEDAVRGIRTDIESTAEILGIPPPSYERLYKAPLTYFDAVWDEAGGWGYVEKPLYPPADPEAGS